MKRRRLQRVLIAVGLAAIALGVFGLERVFLRERADALDTLASRQGALESYAVLDLLERCRDVLDDTGARRNAAREDPLVDGSGLLYYRAGEQALPRSFAFAPGDGAPAKDLHTVLTSGDVPTIRGEDDEPWAERLRYFAMFRDALLARNRPDIERTFRGILTHRARFVIDSRNDLAYTVALLDLLDEQSSADKALMTRMLRDGLTDSRGTHLPGLQPQLLARREKLTRGDFEFLVDRVMRLSESSGVRHDDFASRSSEPSAPLVELPASIEGPMLVDSWFVEPSANGAVEGVAVDLDSLSADTRLEMRERGLIDEGDVLKRALSDAPQRFGAVRVALLSERMDEQRANIETRFWLKTGLAGALFVLTAAALLVGAAWTHRERQLLALKSDFVATVSHELRTPLASMRLMAETLERRLGGSDAARDYPGRLVREIDSLDFLVENILSFNRLEKGRWEPHVEEVRLSELVRSLEQELAGVTRATVRVELAGASDVMLRADPELMKLLLLNLGTNACKYNDDDPVNIRIEAEEREPIVVRLADNGIGIPTDQFENVFIEFYRAESGGRGFGLGLAICRRIMELHSGEIRVLSSSASGTTFEMSFP